eukprot:9652107-Alexandrium_andersonii.AAC.1
MRFSNFTSCKSERPPPSRPSTLHMTLPFISVSTTSRSSSYVPRECEVVAVHDAPHVQLGV